MGIFGILRDNKGRKRSSVFSFYQMRTKEVSKIIDLTYEYEALERELSKLNNIFPYAQRNENKTIHGHWTYGCLNYDFGVTTDMIDLGMSQIFKRMREIEKLLNPIQKEED